MKNTLNTITVIYRTHILYKLITVQYNIVLFNITQRNTIGKLNALSRMNIKVALNPLNSELALVLQYLSKLVGSGGERQPTDTEVQAAVWEACGDSGALQLLVDLLNMRYSCFHCSKGCLPCHTRQ